MFKLLDVLSITILCTVLTNGCLIQMNSDGTAALNKNVTISSTSEKTSSEARKSSNSTDTGVGNNTNSLSSNEDKNSGLYTRKYSGKANERSQELKSPSYMEATCNESVKKQNAPALIESILADGGFDLKPEAISKLSEKIAKNEINKFEVSDCKPTSSEGTFSECECTLSYKLEGGKQSLMDKIK